MKSLNVLLLTIVTNLGLMPSLLAYNGQISGYVSNVERTDDDLMTLVYVCDNQPIEYVKKEADRIRRVYERELNCVLDPKYNYPAFKKSKAKKYSKKQIAVLANVVGKKRWNVDTTKRTAAQEALRKNCGEACDYIAQTVQNMERALDAKIKEVESPQSQK